MAGALGMNGGLIVSLIYLILAGDAVVVIGVVTGVIP
jgi:hypothetical protein